MNWLILHHSAIEGNKPQLEIINQSHKKRGFPLSSLGYWTGYNWFLEKDGTLTRCRTEYEIGAHTVADDKSLYLNRDGIGICLAGNFVTEKPTQFQMEALIKLTEEIIQRHPIKHIVNHRDVKKTKCPGVDLAGMVLESLEAPRRDSLPFKPLTPEARLKTLHRAIKRATGRVKKMLERQLERLLKRV